MRKTIVTALVTLLVMLAVVSCDSGLTSTSTGAEKAEYTADGQKYVTLKVNTTNKAAGASKSLTGTFAQEDWDYLEVIFRKEKADGSGYDYYRTHGYRGSSSLSIKVQVAVYEDTDAIAFIGKRSGTGGSYTHTLLAIGKLSVPSLDLTVATPPTSITFVATALTANLFVDSASPALEITDSSWGTGWTTGDSKKGTVGYEPSFQVPTNKTTIAASLTIGGFTGGLAIYVEDDEPTITFTAKTATGSIDPSDGKEAASSPAGTKKIEFSFATDSAVDGDSYIITFEIPVKFTDATDANLGWLIKGGTKGGVDTTGDSNREGILLSVVDTPATAKNVELDINITGP